MSLLRRLITLGFGNAIELKMIGLPGGEKDDMCRHFGTKPECDSQE